MVLKPSPTASPGQKYDARPREVEESAFTIE